MRKAFTLIETIVVVAVIGLTLPVLFAIIFAITRQQVKIYRLSQIKKEGDYLISVMENTIRDRAITIYKSDLIDDANIVCKVVEDYPSSPVDHLYFIDEDKQFFGYKIDVNKVASAAVDLVSGDPYTVDLTSGKTLVSNFSISCSRSSIYSPASISLSFDVCYDTGLPNCATTRPEEIASLHYQTRIKLRNY